MASDGGAGVCARSCPKWNGEETEAALDEPESVLQAPLGSRGRAPSGVWVGWGLFWPEMLPPLQL